MRGMSAVVRLALWPAGLAVGLASVWLARHGAGWSLAGDSLERALVELAAGYGLLAAGLLVWARRPDSAFGPLAVTAAAGWFLAEWNNPDAPWALVFTLGLVLYASAPPLVAHAALAYGDGRVRGRADRALVAVAYVGAFALLGLAPALAFDPAAQGCIECPRNLVVVADAPDVYADLTRAGVWLGVGWAAALAAVLLVRLARATPALRRVTAPVAAPAAAYLALVSASFARSTDRGFLSNDFTDRRFWLAQGVALVAVALGVAWGILRERRVRGTMARLVVQLAGSPPAGGLRDALAADLGDPTLRLAYPLDGGQLVGADGRPTDLHGAEAVTPLVRGEEQVALLGHRRGLLDDPGLVAELTSAAGLALANERLQAETRAQLENLRASRARIVETGDAERRRLERNLHDGAQQRLVGLALALRLARARVGDDAAAERLDAASEELSRALAELRALAHGIYPAVLADEGLAAALEALAELPEPRVDLLAAPEGRLPPPVEAAAYFVVSELARRSGSGRVTVAARRENGSLLVDVELDSWTHVRLVDLEDRVGALDGRLTLENGDSGTRVRAEIPCV